MQQSAKRAVLMESQKEPVNYRENGNHCGRVREGPASAVRRNRSVLKTEELPQEEKAEVKTRKGRRKLKGIDGDAAKIN